MPVDMSDIMAELKKDPPGWRPAPQPARWAELRPLILFFAALLLMAAAFSLTLFNVLRFLRPLL